MICQDERRPIVEQVARGLNRHREEQSDAAIQGHRFGPSPLDRFAVARDDDSGSTKLRDALDEAATRAAFPFDSPRVPEALR